MRQEVKKQKESEPSIKRIVSDQFLKTINQFIASGGAKNISGVATLMQENRKEFSSIKNHENNRFVDLEMLFRAVNELGINGNHFLVKDGDKTEKLQREGVQVNGGTVSGNNNVVLTGQAVSQNGDVYLNIEKLIQGLPSKERKAILDKICGLNDELADLKKTIARYERELKTNKKIIETQEKLIKMMEKGKS